MSESISLITAPTAEPVSIGEMSAHLNGIPSDDQLADLATKLLAARLYVEGELHRALITSTWEYTISNWPAAPYVQIPLGNLQSVTSVKYAQPGGSLTPVTWEPRNYQLTRVYDPNAGVDDAGCGRLYHAYGIPWPPGPLDVGEPIAIRFVCGWKDAAAVPAPIKAAIQLVAGLLYRNREASITGPREVSVMLNLNGATGAVEALLSRYVVYD